MPNKAPAFQYYPDKYEAHTRHLSDAAYRIYHRILNWMWLHSPDKYSISKDAGTIAVMLCESCTRITDALQEIQNPHMPLLKERREKYISGGLRKEAEKQRKGRKDKARAAKVRWDKEKQRKQEQSTCNTDAPFLQCPPSPSPSPSSVPSPPPGGKEERPTSILDLKDTEKTLDSLIKQADASSKPGNKERAQSLRKERKETREAIRKLGRQAVESVKKTA